MTATRIRAKRCELQRLLTSRWQVQSECGKKEQKVLPYLLGLRAQTAPRKAEGSGVWGRKLEELSEKSRVQLSVCTAAVPGSTVGDSLRAGVRGDGHRA